MITAPAAKGAKKKKKSVIFGVKTEADGGVMLSVQSVIAGW